MRKTLVNWLLAAGLLVESVLPVNASAWGKISVGPKLGYNFSREKPSAGFEVEMPVTKKTNVSLSLELLKPNTKNMYNTKDVPYGQGGNNAKTYTKSNVSGTTLKTGISLDTRVGNNFFVGGGVGVYTDFIKDNKHFKTDYYDSPSWDNVVFSDNLSQENKSTEITPYIGARIRVFPSKKISIACNADYSFSNPTLILYEYPFHEEGSFPKTRHTHEPYSKNLLSIGASIGYSF